MVSSLCVYCGNALITLQYFATELDDDCQGFPPSYDPFLTIQGQRAKRNAPGEGQRSSAERIITSTNTFIVQRRAVDDKLDSKYSTQTRCCTKISSQTGISSLTGRLSGNTIHCYALVLKQSAYLLHHIFK